MPPRPQDDEVIDVTAKVVRHDDELQSLRTLTLVIYVLYALTWITGLSGLVAIIINHVKRDDVRGTLYESHFTWQIRTFWWGLLWGFVGMLTLAFFIGFFVHLVNFVWVVYRLVRGFLAWNDRRPLPV